MVYHCIQLISINYIFPFDVPLENIGTTISNNSILDSDILFIFFNASIQTLYLLTTIILFATRFIWKSFEKDIIVLYMMIKISVQSWQRMKIQNRSGSFLDIVLSLCRRFSNRTFDLDSIYFYIDDLDQAIIFMYRNSEQMDEMIKFTESFIARTAS